MCCSNRSRLRLLLVKIANCTAAQELPRHWQIFLRLKTLSEISFLGEGNAKKTTKFFKFFRKYIILWSVAWISKFLIFYSLRSNRILPLQYNPPPPPPPHPPAPPAAVFLSSCGCNRIDSFVFQSEGNFEGGGGGGGVERCRALSAAAPSPSWSVVFEAGGGQVICRLLLLCSNRQCRLVGGPFVFLCRPFV